MPHYPLFEYPPYSLALASKMVEVARHQHLDLLHVHYAVPNAVSAVLARQILAPRPLPVVTTLHGTDITLVGNDPTLPRDHQFGDREERRGDRGVGVAPRRRRSISSDLEGKPIEVIPNFIDPARSERCAASPARGAGRSRARRSWSTSPTSGRSSG